MEMTTLITETRELAHLFDQQVGPWPPAVMVTKLVAEVGTLADSIMIHEGYRRSRGDALDLHDDLADVLFMLLRIADHYQINIERAYVEMLQRAHSALQSQRRKDPHQPS